jgi:hypothetical protein
MRIVRNKGIPQCNEPIDTIYELHRLKLYK